MSNINGSKCWLHITPPSSQPVIAFTDQTLDLCKQKQQIRKQSARSKYYNIELPLVPDGISGYHASCYRYYTAVKLKDNSISAASLLLANNQNRCSEIDSGGQPLVSECTTDFSATQLEPTIIVNPVNEIDSDREITADEINDPGWMICENAIEARCILCAHRKKMSKGKRQPLHKCDEEQQLKEQIINALKTVPSAGYDLVSETEECIYYHKVCLRKLLKKKCSAQIAHSQSKSARVDPNKRAFNVLKCYVKKEVFEEYHILRLCDIHQIYREALIANSSNGNQDHEYKPSYLLQKLKTEFPNLVSASIQKKVTIVYSSDASTEQLLKNIIDKREEDLRALAYSIRRDIFRLKEDDLVNNNLTSEGTLRLFNFIKHMVDGPKAARDKRSKIIAICHSIIHCVTDGCVKTPTTVSLGLVMKSITGSRKVLNILNRLGYSISYNKAEEIETSLAYIGASRTTFLPSGLLPNRPDLSTGVAFDNLDMYVETADGKNTLHDTVGIVYQNELQCDGNDLESNSSDLNTAISHQYRRRKYISNIDNTLVDYVNNNVPEQVLVGHLPKPPHNIDRVLRLDNIWMATCGLCPLHTEKWANWNSKVCMDPNPQQKIAYLTPINQSPTKDSVVHRTMEIALSIADECGQRHIVVTYDLAIAMKAYKIQASCAPKFDRIFINIGAFHVELSFFKALGKMIEDSGISRILVQSSLIADGSLRGFLSGKHYNRCKNLHPIAALSFKILHFESFLKRKQDIDDEYITIEEITDLLENQDADFIQTHLQKLFEEYQIYFEETMQGKFGRTAQFVSLYIYYMDVYYLYERGLRSSDLNLFKYASSRINAFLFMFNHHNYSRWLCKYVDSLENIDASHRGLNLENGILSVRRTPRHFARSPVDLTLEQTVNANASNKLTGIKAFTNNLGARQRWAETHAARGEIVRNFLEFLNLIKPHDLSNSYQNGRFEAQLKKLLDLIKNCINPFDSDLNPQCLFNLTTGKAASEEVTNFLLNIKETGDRQLKTFIAECVADPSRFYRPIKRNQIRNFSTETNKSRNVSSAGKGVDIDCIQAERIITARILKMCIDRKLDLEGVLSYPLTASPQSLSEIDGSIHNDLKWDIFKVIEVDSGTNEKPTETNVDIINGTEYIGLLHNMPFAYGKMAEYILKMLCNTTALEVHLIFDKPASNSAKINNYEKEKRSQLYAERASVFKINGANQERTLPFVKCWASESFQDEFIQFCLDYWRDDTNRIPDILNSKRIIVSFGGDCFIYSMQKDIGRKKRASSLQNNHENIESKIMLHTIKTCQGCRILVKTSDINAILIYMLYHMQYMDENKTIWIEQISASKTLPKTINVRSIFNMIEAKVINALPGWFTFTGCSFEPAFCGIRRKSTFKQMIHEDIFIEAFSQLGIVNSLPIESFSTLEKYTCQLFKCSETKVNSARVELFHKSNTDIDFRKMPPCRSVLECKIDRANYLSVLIKNCNNNMIQFTDPGLHGWAKSGNKYKIQFYACPQFPDFLGANEIFQNDKDESDTEDEASWESETDNDDDDFIL